MGYVKFCKTCRTNSTSDIIGKNGYSNYLADDCFKCIYCGSELTEICITNDEMNQIMNISTDVKFFESMIALKEKDPIEFQLKLAQFKATTVQQESATQQQNVPKCPTCGSTNIKKISAGSRWLSTGLFGISSGKMGKSMECRNCGYKW